MPTVDSPESSAPRPRARRPGRARRWVVSIALLLAVIVLLGGIKAFQIKTMLAVAAKTVPPPESVSTAQAQQIEIQPVHAAVGTLVAIRGVTLSSEVTGTVRRIEFQNGAQVNAGEVLVRMDVATEEAQLASARADAALAEQTLKRNLFLRTTGANTQQELDTAKARALQARAAVVNLSAVIDKKIIRAPFAGRAGIRSVELGQVVSPGTAIVSLATVTPMYVEFQMPQQALADIHLGQTLHVSVDAFPGDHWAGTVTTINPEVDPLTRNVRMRGTIENPDGRLSPGMYVSVEVDSGKKQPQLMIPATSVVYAPYGDSVYVVEMPKQGAGGAQPVARQQFVRLGARRGDFVEVLSGLEQGATVVSTGAFKLRNGQPVTVNNAVAPNPQLSPKPSER